MGKTQKFLMLWKVGTQIKMTKIEKERQARVDKLDKKNLLKHSHKIV